MRTETLSPIARAISRVRGQTRRLAAHAPASLRRWVIGLSALALVVAIAYYQVGVPAPAGAFVRSGATFSDDDVIAISQALDAKHLPFRVVDDGRIEVSADRLDDANDVIAKLEVGPRRLDDIEKRRAENWSLLDTPDDRLERAEKAHAERLAGYIQRLPGIVSARVNITRPRTRDARRAAQGACAFVYLETHGRREIPHRTVKSIQGLIAGNDPEVKPKAITIMDQTGHSYLDAQNPSLSALSRQRAHEEEYRDEIAKKLDWLTGVQVSVQLVPAPDAAEAPTLVPPADPHPEPPPAAPAEDVHLPVPPRMSMNQPLDPDPDPEPSTLAPKSLPNLAPAPAPTATQEPSAEMDETGRTRARVLVTVPRSFYLARMPNRDPSLEDLQAFVTRTETNIKMAVAIVIPPGRLGEVNVTTIADDLPPTSPPPPANIDTRRSLSWWILAGIAGGATAAALALTFRLLAVRRPDVGTAPKQRERDDRGRYKIDEAAAVGPAPSERVRELIRQNPEAAASVLHRWTGQGGPIG
jgi:flagellar biosynthesis/type III secretory pathway M-ring protein FliF/YscJ